PGPGPGGPAGERDQGTAGTAESGPAKPAGPEYARGDPQGQGRPIPGQETTGQQGPQAQGREGAHTPPLPQKDRERFRALRRNERYRQRIRDLPVGPARGPLVPRPGPARRPRGPAPVKARGRGPARTAPSGRETRRRPQQGK